MNESLEAGQSLLIPDDGTTAEIASAHTTDLQALTDAMLVDASIEECAVVARRARSGSSELVAYVVAADPRGFDRIVPRLNELSGGRIASFVPVFRLPLTGQGAIDHAALARIPVWSDELVSACESRIAAMPDIDRVACVLAPPADSARHVHIDRFLTDLLPAATGLHHDTTPALVSATERDTSTTAPSLVDGGDLPQRPDAPQTLPDLLCKAPHHASIIYIDADGSELVTNYGALLEQAQRLLTGLRAHRLEPGDKVVLQLDRNDDILPAFWGCLLGGFQPVVVPVPLSYDAESRALDHLVHVWKLFDRPLIVTTGSRTRSILESSLTQARLATIESLRDHPRDAHIHAGAPDDVAFYTLSSGSTGLPKAVMLTHRNILARARGTSLLCDQSADDVILNWLPFDHVGSISDWHLRCIDLGCTLVYAPKEYVLGRPLRWLDLIQRYRVTHSWAPNFAYSLVSAALKSEPQREWDLGCVKMLLTAGESITRATTQEFLDSLAPYGLQPSTLQTAFGMAEMGSGVTYHQPPVGHSLTFHHVDRNSLGGTLRPADPADSSAVAFASLGPVIPGVAMRIVDEEQRIVPEGNTGRVQFSGKPISPGYYNNPEANAVFLADGWFDTGDVGFISGGELMLTGRADAGIIINGANFYNNEIETVVEQVDGVTESFTAACAVRPPDGDAQKLAIFFHTPFDDDTVLRRLLRAIQLRLTKQLGIKADYLIPIAQAAVPKTGIGKIQRKRLIDQFQKGVFQGIIERLDLLAGNEHTVLDRFFKKVWRRKNLIPGAGELPGTCLVFLDQSGLGRRIATALTVFGVACVTVEAGETFAQLGTSTWTIRPNEPQDYRELMTRLDGSEIVVDSIVHLFSHATDERSGTGLESFERRQQLGFHSVLSLAHALAARKAGAPVRLIVLSSDGQAIHDSRECDIANATLPTLLQSLDLQLPWLHCIHIDAAHTDASALTREIVTRSADREIAYRGGRRFVSGLERLEIASKTIDNARRLPLRQQGVYVLHNGLEGIGPYLAELLLQKFQARVLLLGRQTLTTEAVPDDPTTRERLTTYKRLQQLPGECAYAAVDLRDGIALRQTVEAHLAQWNCALDGVIHVPARAPDRSLQQPSLDTLSAAFGEAVAAASSLLQLARIQDGCPYVVLSPAAGLGDSDGRYTVSAGEAWLGALIANMARRQDVPVYDFSLHCLDDMATSETAAGNRSAGAARQAVNSILAGLRLGEQHLVIGADDARPRVRARMVDGPIEAQRVTAFFTARRLIQPDEVCDLALTDRYGTPVQCDYVQMREGETAASEQIELWPSIAEYFVYDDLIYYALANDELRNLKYRAALERTAAGKIVLDIGTGKEAILARLAIEAGARKVYAIEKGDEAFAQAVAQIQRLGLDDRITVIHGDAAEVQLPEAADVCVSEIVGPIGGCEGAAAVINDAHRFLRPGGVMIPGRSVTQIAAVRLPDVLLTHPGFYRVPGSYTEKIFAQIGHPFDLRVCIKKFPVSHVLSDTAVFEDLDFNSIIPLEEQHEIDLTIRRESRFDGFLVWLNLHTIAGEVIDILEHEHSWLPVYMPVLDPGMDVAPGDRIRATITRTLSDNRHNPDYVITGTLVRKNGDTIGFTHASYHHEKRFRQHPFYARLFAEDTFGRHPGCRPNSALQYLPDMPLTRSGAVDVARLRDLAQGQNQVAAPRQVPASQIEMQIASVWQDILGVAEVGVHDSFFELGGHSLLLVQAHSRLVELFGPRLTLVDLFNNPTIHSLVELLGGESPQSMAAQAGAHRARSRGRARGNTAVAVIGMACRFPGADDPKAFWRNLAAGTESITFFTDQDIVASGIDPALVRNPSYVKASPILSNIEGFDAEFFGYSAQDATLMDPQQRLLLECAWEALENAGYDSFSYQGGIGVYAGASMNTYLLNNIYPNRDRLDVLDSLNVTTLDSMGGFQLMVANDKDYLPTRVSYKLNLRGPSINVQTACSTGLVAIHLACQSLLNGEADMFLAAGSSVQVPHHAGHLFQDGMIVSPDGHCRAFDAQAKGTIFGSGVGVVVLKRLEDAVRDRDHIVAVIKGSAVNNDGGMKVGYMAPSGDGQASVVAEALAMADVPPDTIGFVEAHGTGTEMGDPIEVHALAQAYRADTGQKRFCAIGSVKTNVGHLQIASGMVGFIKTVLALQHKQIPPSLHFNTPNPAIDFDNSPFYVGSSLTPWTAADFPRRAGVNSLGIGGTNAHVILEEAPPPPAVQNVPERPHHILLLTARNETALTDLAARYAAFLTENPGISLADVCFTANTGRRPFDHRLAVVADSIEQLRDGLTGTASDTTRVFRGQINARGRGPLAFLFTGQGSQYAGMGRQLYDTHPAIRQHLHRCAEILQPMLDRPLLDVLYPADRDDADLHETRYTQPALFALEYALAELWKSWGIVPAVVMGHSLGEYVAACVAGVFSLEDALTLVAARARLMQALPQDGEMAAVFASAAKLQPFLADFENDAAIAAENGPNHTVISGRRRSIEEICNRVRQTGLATQKLRTSHAFHSPLMEPMLADFARVARQTAFASPRIDIISNVTGGLVTDEMATPEYWCRHIRQPVRFMAGMQAIAELGCETFVEIGPRPTLLGLGAACLASESASWLPSLRERQPDWQPLLHSLAHFAVRGPVDWRGFDQDYQRRRMPLPTYPFQRRRYWLERPMHPDHRASRRHLVEANPLLGQKIRLPTLKATVYENRFDTQTLPFLADHRIFGQTVVSGACHIAMLLAAIRQTFGEGSHVMQEIYFLRPLIVPEGESRVVQVVLAPAGDRTSLQIVSYPDASETDASVHVEASLQPGNRPIQPTGEHWQTVWQRCQKHIPVQEFFQAQADRQIHLGASYRWMDTLQCGNRETVCRLKSPTVLGGLDAASYHPGLLDAAFGLLLATAPLAPEDTWLPFSVQEVCVYQDTPPDECWAHLVLRDAGPANRVIADVSLFDMQGQPFLAFTGLEARRVSRGEILRYLPAATQGVLYRKQWRPTPAGQRTAPANATAQWLIFADRLGIAENLARQLRADSARCVLVTNADTYGAEEPDRYRINVHRPQDFQRLLQESAGPGGRYDGIVHLWSLDEADPQAADWLSHTQSLTCASTLHLVQALAQRGRVDVGRLWLVSRGALSVMGETSTPQVQQAALWGIGQTIALEHPELQCTMVDLDPTSNPTNVTDLLETIREHDEEQEIAWRQGVRYVARLSERSSATAKSELQVNSTGTYIITGGTGGLGLRTAEWLVAQGARHLVLAGRRPASPAAMEVVQRLQRAGARVHVLQADVADRESTGRMIDSIRATMPALRGIIHAAGVIDDGVLFEQSWERFRHVLRPKIDGAWHLHELTQDFDLDFFVLFSSAASILGNQGQANYAAANAFLDAFAHYRKSKGLVATSINWGPWDRVGIATSDPAIRERMGRLGFAALSPEHALSVLGQILCDDVTQLTVLDCDWRTYLAQLMKPRSLFSELAQPARAKSDPDAAPDILPRLRQASPEDRESILRELVLGTVIRILGVHDSRPLDLRQPLTEQGLDSLMAVQLRNALASSIGQPLPVSLVFNYPAVNDMVDHLNEVVAEHSGAAAQSSDSRRDKPHDRSTVHAAHELLADLDELLAEESAGNGDG